jgi:hypothetical protein
MMQPSRASIVLGLGWMALAACSASGPLNDGSADKPATADHPSTPTDARDGGTSSDTPADMGSQDRAMDVAPVDMGMPPLCAPVAPATDTTIPYVVGDFSGGGATVWGGQFISGGTYTFQDAPITPDYSQNTWHLTGTITAPSPANPSPPTPGFGLYFQCALPPGVQGCLLDASGYKGIQFKVSAGTLTDAGLVGGVGPTGTITVSLGRAQNDEPNIHGQLCGSCVPGDAGPDSCKGPQAIVAVPSDGSTATVTLLWTDFHDGSPSDSIDPHQITGLVWILHQLPGPDGGFPSMDGGGDDGGIADAAAGSGDDAGVASYIADITIDDIVFVPY